MSSETQSEGLTETPNTIEHGTGNGLLTDQKDSNHISGTIENPENDQLNHGTENEDETSDLTETVTQHIDDMSRTDDLDINPNQDNVMKSTPTPKQVTYAGDPSTFGSHIP